MSDSSSTTPAALAAGDLVNPFGVSLSIDGTWNDRDAASLAGIRQGVLLRTAALPALTDAGRSRLADLRVSDVIDLRSDAEAASQGFDAVAQDVRVHRLPITPGGELAGQAAGALGGAGADPAALEQFVTLLNTPGWADNLMAGVYREIVTTPEAVIQLGRGLRIIAEAEGSVIVHCSAGKDRTGVLVALAALLAGAEQAAVVEAFHHSTHASAAQRAVVPAIPGVDPAPVAPFLGVQLSALHGALDAIESEHGSLPAFAASAGVDESTLAALRARLEP